MMRISNLQDFGYRDTTHRGKIEGYIRELCIAVYIMRTHTESLQFASKTESPETTYSFHQSIRS